ncbi:hypothetical protein ND748_09005 [Frankia sp. AiPs1]|uniref:hypothetical protein n=1 Tax=Frankia sp. AiPs1 TaxID=573493 RepID=UPI002044309C|nr:hypothetical protein [Frankia sp. AiPs1]MCM3921798.1 hypothetical protein [Frankia sp. AiPs1]
MPEERGTPTAAAAPTPSPSATCGPPAMSGRFVEGMRPYLRKDVAAVEEMLTAMGLDANALADLVHSGPVPLLPAAGEG